MKKSIFLFFAAILCAMTANAYNQEAVDLYFDNSTSQWANCYVSVGHTSWTAFYDMERVSGTQYLWKLPANFNGGNSWGGALGWVVSVDKWEGYPKNEDITVKYVWHGDKNVTKLQTEAWANSKIYKADGTESVSKDNTTKTVYKVTSYTNSNYTVTINTVTGGTLTVKDYDNNAVATGASKIHLTVLKFSAAPASGYVLDGVEINDGTNTTTIAAADLATKTHTLTSAVTITPVWRATTSTVTVTATATNGTVTGGGVYEEGTSVTLTATADAGYQFKNWTVAGAEVSTANPYTFTANTDITVTANFEELPKETVYFVNADDWTGTIYAYAYANGGSTKNAEWPGEVAQKEANQIGGHDVYSYTAEKDKYENVIFNNKKDGGNQQTADLAWTADKYYVRDNWYTKEEAEAKLAAPVVDVYTVVGSENLFGSAWTPSAEANDMEKQDDGSYKKVYSNVELTSDVIWKIAKNDNWWDGPTFNNKDNTLAIAKSGIYNVTFVLSADLATATAEAELLEETNTVANCYISGNAALTGGDGWAGNEFKMDYDPATETYSYTLTGLVTDEAYELKVVLGGSWLGYDKLQTVPTGVEDKGGNIGFKLAAAGDVVVTYNKDNGINLTGNFAEPAPEVSVTLYFVNADKWTNLKAHIWVYPSGVSYKPWEESESLTDTDNDHNGADIYSYTFSNKYNRIIWKGDDGKQTTDDVAAYDVATPYYYQGAWYATLDEIPAVVEKKYYVKGTHNEWTADATSEMTLDGEVYKKEVTLAKDVEFKINDGASGWWGKDNLGGKSYNELEGLEGGNLKMKEAKTFTIIFNPADDLITFENLTETDPVVEDYSNQPATIYFRPSTNWKDADARFAAYFFGTEAKWLDMTDSDSDGIYEVANDKTNANVIFCRMNPATTENNWSNKWTQTDDIVIPNEADNLNTVWVPWQNYNYDQQASGIWVAPTPLTDTNWSDFVTAYKGKTINAVVERSFVYEQLHTLCLPFNVELHWLGEEAKAYKLNSVVGNSAQELSLNASECATMTAGQPYIVKPKKGSEYEYLIVADVAVQNVSAGSYTITGGGYKVTMQGIAATDGTQTDGSTEYYIGATTGNLHKEVTDKLGLRALVVLTKTDGTAVQGVRARVAFGENVETGIDNIITTDAPIKVIENGQLIIIRDGVKYNVQGQKL